MSPSKRSKVVDDDDNGDDGVEVQSDQKKRVVRNKLRDIYEKIEECQAKDQVDPEELNSIMQEAQGVIQEVQGTQEAIEDAKMFTSLIKLLAKYSRDTSANERKFVVADYSANIARLLSANSSGDHFKLSRSNVVSLGEQVSSIFNRAPTLKFVLGALNTEIGEVKERRKAVVRPRDKVYAATKTAIVDKSQASEAKTDKYVRMTKKCLDELYLKNKKTPVCYFSFVIDPDHFGKTVENMFHVSFLVKQRQTVLSIGENGLPVLEPIIGRKEEEEESDVGTDQAVISISYTDWVELKNNLKIKKKTINLEL